MLSNMWFCCNRRSAHELQSRRYILLTKSPSYKEVEYSHDEGSCGDDIPQAPPGELLPGEGKGAFGAVMCVLNACHNVYPGLTEYPPSVDYFFWCCPSPARLSLEKIFDVIQRYGWCHKSLNGRSPGPRQLLEADRTAERLMVRHLELKDIERTLRLHRPIICTGHFVSDPSCVCSADLRSPRECIVITGKAAACDWLGWSPGLGGSVVVSSAVILGSYAELVSVGRRHASASSEESWSEYGSDAHFD